MYPAIPEPVPCVCLRSAKKKKKTETTGCRHSTEGNSHVFSFVYEIHEFPDKLHVIQAATATHHRTVVMPCVHSECGRFVAADVGVYSRHEI